MFVFTICGIHINNLNYLYQSDSKFSILTFDQAPVSISGRLVSSVRQLLGDGSIGSRIEIDAINCAGIETANILC